MSLKPRLTALIASAVLAATSAAFADTAAEKRDGDIQNPDYRGKGRFDKHMQIRFKLIREDRDRLVKFVAANVFSMCEDGREERLTFNSTRAKLRDRGTTFERTVYYGSSAHDPSEEFYLFEGEIFDGGRRAKGIVAHLYDPYDPPDRPGPAECSSDGKIPWAALRVR